MSTHQHSFDERFEFAGKARMWSLVGIALGVLGLIYGFLIDGAEYAVQRTFSNLLLMSYYFVGVCLAGVFFCAYQYVSQSGWSVAILRVPHAFIRILPVAALILILVVVAGLLAKHEVVEEGKKVMAPYLYAHWATPGITDVKSENYDKIIAGKSVFLNVPFIVGMLVVFLALYCIIGNKFVKFSNDEDSAGGMSNYNKSFKWACIFLVIFGFTFPIYAFGTIMSLEAHWFSTMFGWYNLAAIHVSGIAVVALTLIILKENGYMTWVTENHLHDLGKILFGFSIFWTYLWFSQFFLVWYANMPEETVYFYKRWEPQYKFWFWLNIVLNFLAPLLLLMSRGSKRLQNRMKITAIVLIVGHWLDYYMMIMPGTVGEHRQFGVTEVLVFIGFAGLFTFLMLGALSKFPSLIPKKHPFLEESLHHHI